jgi:hypothetical protein
MDFYIIDVFAETKYSGNQLAVFSGVEVANLSDEENAANCQRDEFIQKLLLFSLLNNKMTDIMSEYLLLRKNCLLRGTQL